MTYPGMLTVGTKSGPRNIGKGVTEEGSGEGVNPTHGNWSPGVKPPEIFFTTDML